MLQIIQVPSMCVHLPAVYALLLSNLTFIRLITHQVLTHTFHRCLYNTLYFTFMRNSLSANWINGFNIFYPRVNTFNNVFIPHTVWLYTLWDPILYAHWRHLICISWPEDGRNASEICCHEPIKQFEPKIK